MASASARYFALLLATGVAGCATLSGEYRVPETDLPPAWTAPHPAADLDSAAMAEWWKNLGDPLLDGLIGDALTSNTDIATAAAALREARAARDLARAELGPSVTVGGEFSRSDASAESGSGITTERYGLGFDAAWEIDLFGRLRLGLEAAEADVAASAADLNATRVSLVAEVARNYVELRTAENRLMVAEGNLKALQETYDLTRWRAQAGLVSELDVAQARTQLEQTRAALPPLRTTAAESRHRLAILLDLSPGALDTRLGATGKIPRFDDAIAVGIPADMLRHRPDVQAAERQFAAQNARLGEARAARYPSFNLSGSIGLEALTFGSLGSGDAGISTLLAAITAPVFDAGRIRSNIEAQDARLEQAGLNYKSVVLTALEDVENALVALSNSASRRDQLGDASASARQAWQIAQYQYQAGLVDFQSVLDSQRTLLNVEDQLVSSQGDHTTSVIQLYKALGGGWTTDAPSTEPRTSS